MNTPDTAATQQAEILLLDAVEQGLADNVAQALEAGASPNARRKQKLALHIAASRGHIEVAKLLLDAGANVNRRDVRSASNIQTALHMALYSHDLQMVDFLLAKGADPRLTNQDGESALFTLIEAGILDRAAPAAKTDAALGLLERMLAWEGVVNQPDAIGNAPLLLALDPGVDPRTVELLLSRGANPEIKSDMGSSAMHRNWRQEDFCKLRHLIAYGADVNVRDAQGLSALSYVSDVLAMTELVSLGANVNHLDNMGRNALAVALDSRPGQSISMDTAAYLIDAGLDTAHVDYSGASVESRLEESDTDQAMNVLALITARKAKKAMTSVAHSARRRPG